jgi:hypothetical protein
VSDADAPPLKPDAILTTLLRHRVEFVLVGGLAGQGHGARRPTKDLDVCPAWNDANLEQLALALRELGARLKIGEGSIDLLEVDLDGRTLRPMEITTWRTTAGDVDVLLGIPKDSRWALARYEHLVERAVALEIAGQRVLVAALEDIIRSKEIADRPADRAALPELHELRDRQR